MKKFCFVLVLLCLFGFKNQTSSLTVEISGYSSTKGQLGIALYPSAQGFPSDAHHATIRKFYPLTGSTMTIHLGDLPLGTYALAIYHDENKNQMMDKNMFGVPLENFGFSQNPTIHFKSPSFRECAFELRGGPKTVNVKLQAF